MRKYAELEKQNKKYFAELVDSKEVWEPSILKCSLVDNKTGNKKTTIFTTSIDGENKPCLIKQLKRASDKIDVTMLNLAVSVVNYDIPLSNKGIYSDLVKEVE
jgi:hypothetical protein